MFRRFFGLLTVGLLMTGVLASPAQADSVEVATPATPATPVMGGPQPREEARITSEEAQQRLAAFFKLPEQSARVQLQWNLENRGTRPVWDLMLMIREGNGASGSSIASVDAVTGMIRQYSTGSMLPVPVRIGPLDPVKTEAAAREKAWELVKQLLGDRAATLREVPPGEPGFAGAYYGFFGTAVMGDAYQFSWTEQKDGVPVPFSGITVAVHRQTLEYLSLNANLADSITYKPGLAKVTPAEAMARWQGAGLPTLSYQAILTPGLWGGSQSKEYRLVYQYGALGRQVDALTGDWAAAEYPGMGQSAVEPAEPQPVPTGEVAASKPSSLPLTPVEGEKIARALLGLPASARLQSEPYMGGLEPVLRFGFYENRTSGAVQFDPKTGLITHAYRGNGMTPDRRNVTVTPAMEEQARKLAISLVQTYYSQLLPELRLDPTLQYWGTPGDPVRNINFVRYVGGLPVSNDGVRINIDTETMQWRDMNATWTTGAKFPSPVGAMTPGAAKKILLEGRKPVLIYRQLFPTRTPDMDPYAPLEPTAADLVYMLTPTEAPYQIDAITGQPVRYELFSRASLEAARPKYEGHWAEGALQFLLTRQVVAPEQLKADAPLTRAEAVSLLMVRSNQFMRTAPLPVELPFTDLPEGHPALNAVKAAWGEGWLKPLAGEARFRPDAPITRAEFAVWAARALGLGDLARSGLRAEAGFKDLAGLTAEEQNAAAFLQALGYLSPGAAFRGAEPLTQAEGAVLTVRMHNAKLEP